MTVQAKSVHHTAGAESKCIACFVNNSKKGIGARNSGQSVLRTMAPMNKVGQITLSKESAIYQNVFFQLNWVKGSTTAQGRSGSTSNPRFGGPLLGCNT